jgi:hypothetical protein
MQHDGKPMRTAPDITQRSYRSIVANNARGSANQLSIQRGAAFGTEYRAHVESSVPAPPDQATEGDGEEQERN